MVCFVTAASLTSFIETGRVLLERFNNIPWEVLADFSNEGHNTAQGEKLEDIDLDRVIQAYRAKKGADGLEKPRATYQRQVDTDELRKMKKALKGRVNDDELEKLKSIYENR